MIGLDAVSRSKGRRNGACKNYMGIIYMYFNML